ncbi:Os03g0747400 [Oryza sativa Japonica Group]|uniref:Os03g0747400 protein n=1 Tax=Oryza sativa subsp. japonica TaxID=39947 RepID=Q0DNL6_ORYSJ|nr:Os03g0747400 [Oryza sativa Japonica Group]|eukprot:NP_001051258.2 Os03g0747400 [Oryza sativa Japonica Group]
MSQGQPRRPPPDGSGARPVMYGDVFDVSGELAGQPVAPRDAAKLQSAEEAVLGEAQKGGPAAAMQSAAAINARAGHVGRAQVTGAIADEGVAVAVAETELPGRRVVTESVAGQVVARLATPPRVVATQPSGSLDKDAVTIGRALEWRPRPPRRRAAEMLATGRTVTVPGGVAAAAQAAADHNAAPAARDEDRIKLRDVLTGARGKLPADKAATREDAERVPSAEVRNRPDMATTPGGVADAVTAAARLNQERPTRSF